MTQFTKWSVSGTLQAKTETFWQPDDPNLLGKKFLLKTKGKFFYFFSTERQRNQYITYYE